MGSVPGGGVQSTSFASSSSSTAVTSRFAKRFRGVRRSTGDEGRRDHDVARQGLWVGDAVDEHLERGAGSTLDVTAHWFEALTRKREFDTMRSSSPMGRFANENGIHHERREDEDARDARARTPRHAGLPRAPRRRRADAEGRASTSSGDVSPEDGRAEQRAAQRADDGDPRPGAVRGADYLAGLRRTADAETVVVTIDKT